MTDIKQFVFKLQSALDLKLREEDILKENLRRATELYMENTALLSSLKNRLDEIYDSFREIQSGYVDLVRTQNCSDYIPVMVDRIMKQENLTEESRLKMEQVRTELIKTITDRKVMEKLKARQYKEYLQECLRQEQKEIDEMAVTRYIYKDSAV